MGKIKVLHLITHLGIGGAQDNTLLTVQGHARDKYEVHLAAGEDYTEWQERGRACADEFFVIPELYRSANPPADIRTINYLTDFMRQHEYQIVHTHSAKAGTLGRLAARRANVPLVIHTFHSFGWQVACNANVSPWRRYAGELKKQVYMFIERYAASVSDALITVSELNRQEALDIRLAPAEKFTTIYSGIDLNRFNVQVDRRQQCLDMGLDPARPVVGTIGRLSVQKAPLDFVAAAKLVLARKPELQFIMIGDGPLADQVHAAIGDEERIKVFGYRSDIPNIMGILDLFVLTSHWEGLGRALTEAMLSGVPVVATNVDGVPELVTHGETGLLSPPGDPARFAQQILWQLNHPAEATAMSQAARARVAPTFGSDKMVRQIEQLYDRLLAEKEYAEKVYQPVLSH
ncbi:MAG: glycosyltransferase family 4 protein [Caldilineaceae bacterium]